jgi:hypothetical protein
MEFGAIQATAGGVFLLLALAVVWLACRLKRKNRQLRRALAELQRRPKQAPKAAKPEPNPIVTPEGPSPSQAPPPHPAATIDAFLWQHLGDGFLWKHLATEKPVPLELTPSATASLPTGMCDQAALQPFLDTDFPFTGLVVLVGIANSRTPSREHPAQPFIEGLLCPADFACRFGKDEFLIICPGLRGAEAQRRLNEISERLWNFQLRGQGSFSVLFSWGGIGVENEPLSDAIASATERMQQTKRSRVLFFTRKAG